MPALVCSKADLKKDTIRDEDLMFHTCFEDFHFRLAQATLQSSVMGNAFPHASILPSQANEIGHNPDLLHFCSSTEILSMFSSVHYIPMQHAGFEKQAVSREKESIIIDS